VVGVLLVTMDDKEVSVEERNGEVPKPAMLK
jgi:hypothetical protein